MTNKLGIIVPYRDRFEQLILFKHYITEYLETTDIDYEIINLDVFFNVKNYFTYVVSILKYFLVITKYFLFRSNFCKFT